MRIRSMILSVGMVCGLVSLVGGSTALADVETYTVDPAHSTVLFRVKHLDVTYIYGRFNKMSGTFDFDAKEPAKCSFEITINVRSLDTNANGRDKHLKSPDFFNVKEFPKATFKSTAVERTGKNEYQVTGDFALHGVTKSITVPMIHSGFGPGLRGGHIRGFECTFTIQRSDFGMNFMLGKLGDEVRITVSLEGKKE